MTIPERTPLAVDHGLNVKRIEALLDLYRTGSTDAHGQTLKSLRQRELVTSDGQLTFKGISIAKELNKLDTVGDKPEGAADAAKEDDTEAELQRLDAAPRGYVGQDDPLSDEEFTCPGEAEQVTHHIQAHESAAVFDGAAALFPATFQVLCRGRRSGEHSQLIAVVVGKDSDAQRVADEWNLAHLADIAARSDATFAVAVPAEVGVYLFERFAVVEHS